MGRQRRGAVVGSVPFSKKSTFSAARPRGPGLLGHWPMAHTNESLELVTQGPRLNLLAAVEVSDVNEAHLIVHGVLARAMNGVISNTTRAELDADLAYALHLREGRSALWALA